MSRHWLFKESRDIGIIQSKVDFKEIMQLAIYGNLDLYSDEGHENEFRFFEGTDPEACCYGPVDGYFSSEPQDIAKISTYLDEKFDKVYYLKMPFESADHLVFDMKEYRVDRICHALTAVMFGLRYFYKKEGTEFEVSSDNCKIFTSKDLKGSYNPYGEFDTVVGNFIEELLDENNKKVYIKYSEKTITILINQ